jgi:purine-binding chemotaxis protein CheW
MSAPKAESSRGALDPDESIKLVTFRVGKDLFALDIMRIREIVRPLKVTPVPKSPGAMLGVVDMRGQVLPVFDLRRRFDLPPLAENEEEHARTLIVAISGRILGIRVDEVLEVVTVKRRDMQLEGAMMTGEASRFFVGVAHVGDDLVLLLNLLRVLSSEERIAIDEVLGMTGRKNTGESE